MHRTTFDEEKKQWNGPKLQPVYNLESSVGNVLLHALETNGTRTAYICAKTNEITTFEELRKKTICVARNLRKYGFKKGDVLYVMTNNTSDIGPIFYAALCLGCPIATQAPEYMRIECLHHLNLIKPNHVFCDLDCYSKLKEYLIELNQDAKMFTFGGQMDISIPVDSLFETVGTVPIFVPADINGRTDVAFILQSSGTTGLPKAVRLSHAALLERQRGIKSTDVVLKLSSPAGIIYIRAIIEAILAGASSIVNHGPITPERFFEIVERFKVTHVVVSPYFINKLLNHPLIESANLSSFRLFIVAGSHISFDSLQRMSKYLKERTFGFGYGMNETTGTMSLNIRHKRNNCVGQLISRFEAKIIGEHGNRLGINEVGELFLRLPCPFLGYLGDNPNLNNILDNEGFLATGDIARFDENNDLFIVDRKREMFKCVGWHLFPAQMEAFLNQIAGVKMSSVVEIPNIDSDNLIAAVIEKFENIECTEEIILKSIADNTATWKHSLVRVYFVDSIPITHTGKISRRLVKEMAIEFYGKENKLEIN